MLHVLLLFCDAPEKQQLVKGPEGARSVCSYHHEQPEEVAEGRVRRRWNRPPRESSLGHV